MRKPHLTKRMIKEAKSKDEFAPVFGKDVVKNNKKYNDESYKLTKKRTNAIEGAVGGIEITEENDTDAQVAFERSSKGNERLKYDLPVSDRTKEHIEKHIVGKNGKEVAPGESVKGNEKFLKKAKRLNKWDNENPGHNTSVDQIAPIEKTANLKKHSGVKENRKRLNFKRTLFLSEEHMFNLIPEDFKKDGYKFYMKDRDDNDFLLEWSDKENKPFILDSVNKNMINESFNTFHRLLNYKSSDYVKTTTPKMRVNESKVVKEQVLKNKNRLI